MLGDLSGKSALVTGGAQGVGLAIARAMAEQGADVAIGDVAKKLLPQAEADLKRGGHRVLTLEMDVTRTPSVESAVTRIVSEWGKLDILVNNAGVVGAPGWIDSDEDRDVDWDFVLDVNLRGVVRCCKAALPGMMARRYGKIVNIASTAGRGGSAVSRARGDTMEKPGGSPYAVSKAGVIRYTQALATSVARHNINVNCICPSRMFTQMGIDITVRRQKLEPGLKGPDPLALRHQHATDSNAFKRELLPEDVGKMAAFLASEDTHNVTGQTIHVDGGGILI